MKKYAALVAVLLCVCLCVTALADWTCDFITLDGTPCGQVNEDGSGWCIFCGADEPVHGLTVSRSGEDFLRLKWFGEQKEPMLLYWAVSGTADWMIL